MSKLHVFSLCGAIAMAGIIAQPALAQNNPKAVDQLKKANEGAKARDHVFDGRKAPANAVKASPAQKTSPVGQPVVSTPKNPGYKPAPPRMHTVNVPSPTVTRSTTTVTSPTVSRSTTTASTPSVSRSTTTTTTPAKTK